MDFRIPKVNEMEMNIGVLVNLIPMCCLPNELLQISSLVEPLVKAHMEWYVQDGHKKRKENFDETTLIKLNFVF
jgi:hypothetical protein